MAAEGRISTAGCAPSGRSTVCPGGWRSRPAEARRLCRQARNRVAALVRSVEAAIAGRPVSGRGRRGAGRRARRCRPACRRSWPCPATGRLPRHTDWCARRWRGGPTPTASTPGARRPCPARATRCRSPCARRPSSSCRPCGSVPSKRPSAPASRYLAGPAARGRSLTVVPAFRRHPAELLPGTSRFPVGRPFPIPGPASLARAAPTDPHPRVRSLGATCG